MKLICNKVLNGTTVLLNVTTPIGNQAAYVKQIAGVGNPFWMWNSIPSGKVIACDFTDAPIVDADNSITNARIAAITALPEDVLTYAS